MTRLQLRGIICGALLAIFAAQAVAETDPVSAGEAIYLRGTLPSGKPLLAQRDPDLAISGADAACVNCHRRSGLGELDGRISIPPISGIYLFHPKATNGDDSDLPFVPTMRPDREPYTEATLARAVREGVAADGRPLNYLMPHYALADTDLAALVAYLKQMTPRQTPGVTGSILHFATVITPDADPVKRRAMLDVLERFFSDKNAFARAASPRMSSSHRMMFKANRRWSLHVWELHGGAKTWEAQLRQHLAQEPVLAVISGLGGKNWQPVHRFCERSSLPCLFPNVELPVVAEHDFYSLYFSKGVLLEAGLIAQRLIRRERAGTQRLVQVYRTDDIGASAARALRQSTAALGAPVIDRPVSAGVAEQPLLAALRDLTKQDVLILWLRPNDVAALAHAHAAPSTTVMSGLMAGLDQAPVPSDWRRSMLMTYPFDPPEQRRIRMDYALGWFRIRQIPVVDERLQADTFLACSVLSETLNHMADSFIRDYLVEQIEASLEHRIITGYYPRLALAPNQRFASKGGYIVHYADVTSARVLVDGDWIVP